MPSMIGHAFIGGVATQIFPNKSNAKRLLFLSLFSCLVADADVITLFLGIPYDSFFGHRGFSHSIFFSLIIAFLSTGIFLRTMRFRNRNSWGWFFYFFLVSVSHPVLDAMTTGGHGVALFSPFVSHRYFFNIRTIYVSPIFVSEFISPLGIRILFKEMVCIGLPSLLLIGVRIGFNRALRDPKKGFLAFLLTTLSLILVGALSSRIHLIREELVPGINSVNVHRINATLAVKNPSIGGIGRLPLDNIPGKYLRLNYNDLLKEGLLNTLLKPNKIPWSGSSFPFWFGGAAGRWQESYLSRVWKVLMGESFTNQSTLLSLLHHSKSSDSAAAVSELRRLSPTEKYDIAVGDYHLGTTRMESIMHGIGSLDTFPHAPFWSGYCTWMSLAALFENEPLRPVKVLNSDGYEVEFLPEDIKALLAISYLYISPPAWQLGSRCDLDGPKSDACIDVDPAELVVALTNYIGLAKTSFLINKEPFSEIQTAPIRSAEVRIINPPYFSNERRPYFAIAETIKWLVDVEIRITVSKITAFPGVTNEESLSYRATLGLDSNMNLLGGRWEDPFSHPDFAWGGLSVNTQPALDDKYVLGNRLQWGILKTLLKESSREEEPQSEPLMISSIDRDPIYHGLIFRSEEYGINGRVAYWNIAKPAEIYGYVEGTKLNKMDSIELVVLSNESKGLSDMSLAIEKFSKNRGVQRQFFKLQTPGSLENLETVGIRFNRIEDYNSKETFHFILPQKTSFERLRE